MYLGHDERFGKVHAKFWSAALLHAVYLHNRRCHKALKCTPFKAWYGIKPNLKHLKLFGSCVSVKRTGKRRAKLDRHAFRGIFLGYSATDANIRYLDIDSGITKRSHHAVFDEAWYTATKRPPAAQMLYDLGASADVDFTPASASHPPAVLRYPPSPLPFTSVVPSSVSPPTKSTSKLFREACNTPLPWNLFSLLTPSPTHARAAKTSCTSLPPPLIATPQDILDEYLISSKDMSMIFLSPDPYQDSFEEILDLRRFDLRDHPTAGMSFIQREDRLFLAHMVQGTPGAKIPRWHSRLRDAWLIKINDIPISSLADARSALHKLQSTNTPECTLLFSHPSIKHGLTNDGIPQINIDQLNNRLLLRPPSDDIDLRTSMPHLSVGSRVSYSIVQDETDETDVLNCVTKAMKLTRSNFTSKMTGMTGSNLSISNWINTNNSICSVILFLLL